LLGRVGRTLLSDAFDVDFVLDSAFDSDREGHGFSHADKRLKKRSAASAAVNAGTDGTDPISCADLEIWSGRIGVSPVRPRFIEIDFIAAYIIPEDSWFIVPLPHVLGQVNLLFRPGSDRRRHAFDRYREAWHLLREPDGLEFA